MADTIEILKKRLLTLVQISEKLGEQRIAAATIVRDIGKRADIEAQIDAEVDVNQEEIDAVVAAIEEIEEKRKKQ